MPISREFLQEPALQRGNPVLKQRITCETVGQCTHVAAVWEHMLFWPQVQCMKKEVVLIDVVW